MTVNTSLPLVSVIIRSMNRPELAQALASVAQQTHARIEVLVVDASGDGHPGLSAQCGPFPLRLLSTGEPLYRSRAANLGLESAGGDWLIFLDDDDWFLPRHIESLLTALGDCQQPVAGAHAVVDGVRLESAGAQQLIHRYDMPFNRQRLLVENYIPIHAVLFRREVVSSGCRFDEMLNVYEDWDFWLKATADQPLLFVNQLGACYRIAETSGFGLGNDHEAINRSQRIFFRKWRQQWSDEELMSVVTMARNVAYLEASVQRLEKQQDIETRLRDRMNTELGRVGRELSGLSLQHNRVLAQRQHLSAQVDVLARRRNELNLKLRAMSVSLSWRATSPLRTASRLLRQAAAGGGKLRRMLVADARKAVTLYRGSTFPVFCEHLRRALRHRIQRWRSSAPSAPTMIWQLQPSSYPLSMPGSENPVVSVVVSFTEHHQALFTCLKSVAELDRGLEMEVLLGAPEDMSALGRVVLAKVDGMVQATCAGGSEMALWQAAAARAKGEYLFFVRGDMVVADPGVVSVLLSAARCIAGAGVVGAKLLSPDGSLFAAGGILTTVGGLLRYGQGDRDADAPEYSYLRETAFCPDGGWLVRRDVFEGAGGFGRALTYASPFNDAAFACGIREAGYAVVYQPQAWLLSFTRFDSYAGLHSEAAQVVRERFHDEFAAQLARQLPADAPQWLTRDLCCHKRVLIVDMEMITPDQDSGSLRMFCMIEELIKMKVKVAFASRILAAPQPYVSRLQQMGVEVLYRERVPSVEAYIDHFGRYFDAIVLSRFVVAEALMARVREAAPQAKIVFDTVDLHFLREQRLAELQQDEQLKHEAKQREQAELGLMRQADLTLVVSPYEKELLNSMAPDVAVAVLSNIHEIYGSTRPFAEREGIVFIGGFRHQPNVDAVLYYVHEVAPLVLKALGPVKTWIVGSHPPAEIQALASEQVIIEGFVPDISEHFARARLSVAPLRFGAGVKGKVNMSMSYGVPCVVTPVAAEGMGLVDGEDVLIGEDARALADCIVRLYQDAGLWRKLSENGLHNVEKYFSRSAAQRSLQLLVDGATT